METVAERHGRPAAQPTAKDGQSKYVRNVGPAGLATRAYKRPRRKGKMRFDLQRWPDTPAKVGPKRSTFWAAAEAPRTPKKRDKLPLATYNRGVSFVRQKLPGRLWAGMSMETSKTPPVRTGVPGGTKVAIDDDRADTAWRVGREQFAPWSVGWHTR
jgi:hypothetical protein